MKMTWGGVVLFGFCFVLSSFGSMIVNSLLLLSLLGVTPKMILEMVYYLEGWLFTSWFSNLYVKESLGKMLNPELPPLGV